MTQTQSDDQHDEPLAPGQEPLTPEEKEAFLARARAEGRALTEAEIAAIFEPSVEPKPQTAAFEEVEEMEPAFLDETQLAALAFDFFQDVDASRHLPRPRLINGVIFDFDYTLAEPVRPIEDLMEEGARNAEAYMRSTDMELPDDFYASIIEARRFARKKSDDEQEEHIADDAMSFLLQFYGYPASQMDPQVLSTAVDIFYAPEMTAWRLRPGARALLTQLQQQGYKLALLANYPCDRVFQRLIDYLAIRPYFDLCLCSASVEFRKPDVQFFNLALERWDVMAYETVVVGDSLAHDIQGGLELGSLTVQITQATDAQAVDAQTMHDNARLARKIKADATVHALDAVAALVAEWT